MQAEASRSLSKS